MGGRTNFADEENDNILVFRNFSKDLGDEKKFIIKKEKDEKKSLDGKVKCIPPKAYYDKKSKIIIYGNDGTYDRLKGLSSNQGDSINYLTYFVKLRGFILEKLGGYKRIN